MQNNTDNYFNGLKGIMVSSYFSVAVCLSFSLLCTSVLYFHANIHLLPVHELWLPSNRAWLSLMLGGW